MEPIYRSHGHLIRWVIVFGAIAAAISLFLLYRNNYYEGDGVLVSMDFPSQGLSLVDGSGEPKEVTVRVPGTLADIARGGLKTVAVVRKNDGAVELFSIGLFNSTQITDDGDRKESVAVSPDGKWIAYAGLTNVEEAETSLSSWTIYVRNVETKDIVSLYTGYGPQFFTRNGVTRLLFTTQRGIAIADPATQETHIMQMELPNDIHSAAVVSPDGKYLAVRIPELNWYSILTFMGEEPDLSLSAVGTVNEAFSSATFHDGMFIGLNEGAGVTMLRSFNPADPSVGTDWQQLPQSSVPYYLLP